MYQRTVCASPSSNGTCGAYPSSVTLGHVLAALLHRVPGRWVGHAVLSNTFRHPALLAKEVATLDLPEVCRHLLQRVDAVRHHQHHGAVDRERRRDALRAVRQLRRGLRRRRGLLTRTDVTLPARRAQAAIVGTGPLRDSLGWRDLKLQSLASDEGGAGDHVLAPLATDEEVGTILDALGWRPLSGSTDWKRVSSVYIWTLAIGLSPLLLLAALAALQAPNFVLGIPVIAGLLIVRWRGWKRTLYALDGDRLLVRTGWWRRRTVILPLKRIQSIDLFESFISRWFGISGLAFGVAGGRGYSAHVIPALPRETARALRQRLLVLEP